jgi:glutathione S-transferase
MKVHGHPMSTCTRKVLTTLAEKGVEADLQVVDFAKGEHKQADHMALQPFGKLPALVDDGFVLFESRAIAKYLDNKLPGPKLHGKDAKTNALVDQWSSVEQSHFTPSAMKIIYATLLGPMFGKPVNEEQLAEGRAEVDAVLPILERQLSKTKYFAGDEFTLADIGFMPYVEYIYAGKQGDVFDKYPSFLAWWKRVSERPSWQKVTGKSN